jgi:adenosylcobinamide-GDP ribazoletransferase
MKNLGATFQFLTVLPMGKPRTVDAAKMVPWFPIVGLVMGLIMVIGDYASSMLWTGNVVALLDVLLLVVLSGGLHLDGLGDTADGLFSHRPREKTLEIMRDSRIGVMGLLAILFVLAVKWASLRSLVEQRTLYLLIIPAYSRGAMMFGIQCLKYGRPDGGMGTDFFSRKPPTWALWTILLPIFISGWLGWHAIALNVSFMAMTILILFYYERRLGCVTGDMLGAMVEVLEAWLLLVACIGVAR